MMSTVKQILEHAIKHVLKEHGIQITSVDIRWTTEHISATKLGPAIELVTFHGRAVQ